MSSRPSAVLALLTGMVLFIQADLSGAEGSQRDGTSRPTSQPANRISGRKQQRRIIAAKVDLAVLRSALDMFEIDCGRYPTTQEGLPALLERPANLNDWKGPYIKQMPIDPWGNKYTYVCPGKHNPKQLDVFSPGPDGKAGTDDDIGNW